MTPSTDGPNRILRCVLWLAPASWRTTIFDDLREEARAGGHGALWLFLQSSGELRSGCRPVESHSVIHCWHFGQNRRVAGRAATFALARPTLHRWSDPTTNRSQLTDDAGRHPNATSVAAA
jgi:hypothetical protein